MKYLKIALLLGLFACSEKQAETKTVQPPIKQVDTLEVPKVDSLAYFKVEGDSLIIPFFEIELRLSQKAEKTLQNTKESVIVSAYFSGIPKDKSVQEYQESGEITILNKRIELWESRIAKFENVKIAKSSYDSLENNDIKLLINVFTGRRVNPDNLLSCDIVEEKLSEVQGKKYVLKGALIQE